MPGVSPHDLQYTFACDACMAEENLHSFWVVRMLPVFWVLKTDGASYPNWGVLSSLDYYEKQTLCQIFLVQVVNKHHYRETKPRQKKLSGSLWPIKYTFWGELQLLYLLVHRSASGVYIVKIHSDCFVVIPIFMVQITVPKLFVEGSLPNILYYC